MSDRHFVKYHGLGNDFVVIADETGGRPTPAAARRLCDRRRGIGADGVLVVRRLADGSGGAMEVVNADGSFAEMCGNGLRCVVDFLDPRPGVRLALTTGAGVLYGWREGDRVGVTMGIARRIETIGRVEGLPVGGAPRAGLAVSLGNPHLVLDAFARGTDLMALAREHGPALERHPSFVRRTNVGFYAPDGDAAIRLVVFERGAGITEACGTGASAAVAAMVERGEADLGADVKVTLPGGPLTVRIDAAGDGIGEVTVVGEVVRVFEGRVAIGPEEWTEA